MDDTTRKYSPAEFTTAVKAILKNAEDAGVSQGAIAHGLMGLAHAYWDECYGPAGAENLLADIKAKHPTWAEFEESMQVWNDPSVN